MFRFQIPPSPSLSEVPVHESPPGSPKGPYREICPFLQPSFTCLSEFLKKVLLIKQNLTVLSTALGKQLPPMFPKTGLLRKQTPIPRALLSISFGVPSKGALPPGSPHRAPTERDAPSPEPSFIRLSKSLVNKPPSRLPTCCAKKHPISTVTIDKNKNEVTNVRTTDHHLSLS